LSLSNYLIDLADDWAKVTTDMLETSVLLALCSLTIYGLTQVISKQVVGSMSATSMVAVNLWVTFPMYAVFIVGTLLTLDIGSIPFEYIVYGLIGAVTARGGYYLFLESLEKGSVTMVGSITAAFPAITAALAVTLLGENLNAVNAVGVATIIASMVALSYSHSNSSEASGFPRAALVLSIAVLLIWGFGGVFIKLALSELPLIAYLGLYVFILPPLAFAYLKHRRATRSVVFPKWALPVIGAVIVAELWQLGYFAETAAVSEGAASIVYPLISAYPVVTIVAAHFFLKEKVSGRNWAILGAVILGVVLASLP
jgi:drug/metabolite transporter (DMT)-like permease